jgi:hypothetical protein
VILGAHAAREILHSKNRLRLNPYTTILKKRVNRYCAKLTGSHKTCLTEGRPVVGVETQFATRRRVCRIYRSDGFQQIYRNLQAYAAESSKVSGWRLSGTMTCPRVFCYVANSRQKKLCRFRQSFVVSDKRLSFPTKLCRFFDNPS